MGDFRGSKIQKSGKCNGLPRKSIIFFNPHPTLWLGVLGLKDSKTRKFHELPRKWFHLKPLTPTHPGGAVLGDTGREGGREEEGRSKGAGREEAGGGRGRRE